MSAELSAPSAPLTTRPPVLSVVVPTFNERANVPVLFDRLTKILADISWEMIVVDDDSSDGTWAWARQKGALDHRLRCLRRVSRRGLAGACIEGVLSSSARFVAIIDGDLQHDEEKLAAMWRLLADGRSDLVIGVRRPQSGVRPAMGRHRRQLSDLGASLSRLLLRHDVNDPMSGFFMMRRDLFEAVAPILVADGFKILLDILMHLPRDVRVREIDYVFRSRTLGESKLDARVLVDYAGLLVHHLSCGLIPTRMTAYLIVGLIGLFVHLALLRALIEVTPSGGFYLSEVIASYAAMIVNFLLNNALTFRERRLRGWALVPAMATFCVVCSMGVLANLSVTNWLFADAPRWWLAGPLGALVSAFWNYAMSAVLVWPGKRRDAPVWSVRRSAQTELVAPGTPVGT